jgi:FkbM family methyltransferase
MSRQGTAGGQRWWIFKPAEVAFMAIPLLAVASLYITRVPLYSALYLIGRAGDCSFASAVGVERHVAGLNRTTKQILAASQVDQHDQKGALARWKTPHGVFWAPLATSVPFLLSEQLHKFYGDGERRVRKGDIVLDCGANIGAFTWEALQAGASMVVAIEPSERNVECLRRNFANEIEQGRVIVYPKGVWHRDETLEFFVYENSALDSAVMSSRTEEQKQARKVQFPVTTIDRIVQELKLERVNFIKMDIEGAERHALQGSRETLTRFRPRMSLAIENLPDDPEIIPALVKQLRPDYKRECGRCMQRTFTQLQPDAYYFY